MGNRGCLHDDAGEVVRTHRGRRWICCDMGFEGRTREPAPPGRYTSLFFLDEATALAAGHRPCWECRRTDAARFRAAWTTAAGADPALGADAMDTVLHAERTGPRATKTVSALPDGVMVVVGDVAHLVVGATLRPWAPEGYGTAVSSPPGLVEVLTPRSVVGALRGGYVPALHPTAGA